MKICKLCRNYRYKWMVAKSPHQCHIPCLDSVTRDPVTGLKKEVTQPCRDRNPGGKCPNYKRMWFPPASADLGIY